ncbi:hypothetical protein J4227_06945 [Candidatus Woesearchaeota archaeon]|nr:hypothetical protein [Candidatus Woesearchaeota archaeon]
MGEEQRYITPQKQQSTDYGRRKFIGNGLILLAGYAAGTTLLAGAGFAKRDSWPPRSDKELIIGSIDTAVMMAHLDYDAMVEKIKDRAVKEEMPAFFRFTKVYRTLNRGDVPSPIDEKLQLMLSGITEKGNKVDLHMDLEKMKGECLLDSMGMPYHIDAADLRMRSIYYSDFSITISQWSRKPAVIDPDYPLYLDPRELHAFGQKIFEYLHRHFPLPQPDEKDGGGPKEPEPTINRTKWGTFLT